MKRRTALRTLALLPLLAARAPLTAYGDSITAGWGASTPARSYAALVASALGRALDTRAIGGSTIAQQLAALQPPGAGPVILLAGTNDMRAGTPLAEYRAALADMVALLPGVWVAGPLSMTPAGYAAYGPAWSHGSDAAVAAYRAATAEIAGARYVPVVYDPANVAADLVHPNDAGHTQIAESFLRALLPWRVSLPLMGDV